MFAQPGPGYSALSRGRYSAVGEEYFLTFNLQRPQHGLCEAELLSALNAGMRAIESDGSWLVRTGVVMPDHVHLLARLGGTMTLSEVVRRYKGRLTRVLRQHQLSWQRSFFDHRLRREEDLLPIFLYIFLNPYRAGLAPDGASWPGYYCAPDDWVWFGPLTKQGTPFPEWLEDSATPLTAGINPAPPGWDAARDLQTSPGVVPPGRLCSRRHRLMGMFHLWVKSSSAFSEPLSSWR